MKSIPFAMPGMFDMILAKIKTITGRCIAVPRYTEKEIIRLRENIDGHDGRVVLAKVINVTPVRVKDITNGIAIKEGFDKKEDSINFFKGYYKLKDENYVFFTEWELIESRKIGDLK